jgi:arylsulfatase A-like enzyme
MAREFQGKIELDVRDSVADWDAFRAPKPQDGAPNVLVVLYDDTGMAAWSPYGGRISMPTMDRLAQNGLTYSQWHTTALCSPTRSTFLTGRNHHQNGFATISESSTGFPGYNSHIPESNATMAHILRDAGWSTFWVGKNHNIPIDEWTAGASKKHWPLAQGYDRFYGFIGGETNNWYPSLAEDNHYIDQPYLPEQGYHLSKDLADQALTMIRDVKQTEPDKPWYLWFCPGANHAPHHAPQEYIDKYKGQFDDGYEAYRDWVLERMVEKGILPADTALTDLNPMPDGRFNPTDEVRPWDSLNADEKAMFSRMAEVYAGFSEYTDSQVGRIVDYLEESGQLDNTLIIYCADNGASGEGSPNGSVNEGKIFGGYPDDEAENLRMVDELGSPATYNHYPPAGRRRSRRRTRCSSATPTRAASATRWSSTGPPGSRRGARSVISTTTRRTSCRPSWKPAGWSSPRSTTGSSRHRSPACRWATPSTPRRRVRRGRRRSTTRCSDSAASGTRAGRPSRSTDP